MTFDRGIIYSVAGTGERGYTGDGGAATASDAERALYVRV